MSVQNEIERINNNVQAALSVVADAGVSVPENANSNNLPAAVSALANEKQDKLTGTKGQIVGFDSDGKPVAQDKTSYGVATLGADGKLTGTQVPMQQIIAVTNAAEYSATATYALGDYCTYDGKLYRCTTVITEAEAWTAAHWTETTMGAELVSIYTTLQNKADASHTHDDRYYTETEVNDLLSEKAPAYTYGTEDLTAGTSPLETGKLYFVYE